MTTRSDESSGAVAAARAAVGEFGRSLAGELGRTGIRVKKVRPGLIETPLVGKLGLSEEAVEAFSQQIAQQEPLGRPGRAEEIASTALFLASDDSSYFTGAELVADGGLTHV